MIEVRAEPVHTTKDSDVLVININRIVWISLHKQTYNYMWFSTDFPSTNIWKHQELLESHCLHLLLDGKELITVKTHEAVDVKPPQL
jgi:hypothetical protein